MFLHPQFVHPQFSQAAVKSWLTGNSNLMFSHHTHHRLAGLCSLLPHSPTLSLSLFCTCECVTQTIMKVCCILLHNSSRLIPTPHTHDLACVFTTLGNSVSYYEMAQILTRYSCKCVVSTHARTPPVYTSNCEMLAHITK